MKSSDADLPQEIIVNESLLTNYNSQEEQQEGLQQRSYNKGIGVASLNNEMYKLNTVKSEGFAASAVHPSRARLWHRRLGHISVDLDKMKNGAVEDVTILEKEDISDNTQIVVQETTNAREDSQSVEEESQDDRTVLNPNDLTYVPDTSCSSSTSENLYHTLCEEDDDSRAVEIPELPSKRLRKPVERYGVSNLSITDNQKSWDGEITYEEAIKGPDREMWEQAMEQELKAFEENQAWELVDAKEADRVVQCKWVFNKKLESDNKFVNDILIKFNISDRNGIDTPIECNLKLDKSDNVEQQFPYQQLLGSLM
ncbi:unnamed protein product [Euphydryas editha]|uniref:Retrovirus-related Pol polyprotein from transposon TNT 1-94 n=1 Tax=Euphydryas editha TaxID=104508 RepID=A0AAU9V5E2_EUPED|nr:unnamed protein product [Euphydryas editha]